MKNQRRFSLIPLLALASSGCFLFESDDDSVPIGSLHIEAALQLDTCGPGALGTESFMSYDVALERSGSSITWVRSDGATQGSFSSDSQFCVEVTNRWHVRDGDQWYGIAPCDMVMIERLCGTLTFSEADADLPTEERSVSSLTGRHEAFVSSDDGADCSDQIGINEGQYLDIPCQITYDLTGAPTSD